MKFKTKFVIAGVLALLFAGEVMAGTLKDSRDGKTYKTVKIGEQTWMAENLNYKMKDSYCYDNAPSNCEKYGRLYIWNSAKEACPSGWHLPSKIDFERLLALYDDSKMMSKALREKKDWGDTPGNNSTGFSALPAGEYSSGIGLNFVRLGISAIYWSSTERYSSNAYTLLIGGYGAGLYDENRTNGYSVRCLQDSN